MRVSLVEHLEHYLGEIQDGWKPNDAEHSTPFQVVRYRGAFEGSVAFSTLGLSRHVLRSRVSLKSLRCELIVMARDSGEWIPRLLDQIGCEICLSAFAPLRGDVIGPRGRIADQFAMTSFYVSVPVWLPDEFACCELPNGEQVVFVWLIPVHSCETEFIEQYGWQRFEDELEKQDPDLLDMQREAIVEPSATS